MARQSNALGLVLGQLQSAFDTAATVLDATDVLEIQGGYSIDQAVRTNEVDLVGGGWTQNQSVLGPRDATVSMTMPLRTGGAADSVGQIATLLKASMLDETDVSDVYTYVPTAKYSEWNALTLWNYSGNLDSSGCMLEKFHNVIGSMKFSLDFGTGVALATFDGKGVYSAAQEAGTQPDVTPSAIVVPSLVGATISFFSDTDYCLLSIEFDLGFDVSPTLQPNATDGSGLGVTVPGKMKAKWTAKVYHDTTVNPITALLARTLGTISIAWGTAPNKFTISTTKAMITEVKKSEDNGITTYDLSGILVDNNISIAIDTTST